MALEPCNGQWPEPCNGTGRMGHSRHYALVRGVRNLGRIAEPVCRASGAGTALPGRHFHSNIARPALPSQHCQVVVVVVIVVVVAVLLLLVLPIFIFLLLVVVLLLLLILRLFLLHVLLLAVVVVYQTPPPHPPPRHRRRRCRRRRLRPRPSPMNSGANPLYINLWYERFRTGGRAYGGCKRA